MSQPKVSASSLREVVMLEDQTPDEAILEVLADGKARLLPDIIAIAGFGVSTINLAMMRLENKGRIRRGWAVVNGRRTRAVQLKK